MSIVVIGLIIGIVILMMVFIAWIYMFVENMDPKASAAFYRDFSLRRTNGSSERLPTSNNRHEG